MKTRIVLLIILVVLGVSTAISQTTAEDYNKLGIESSRINDFGTALEYFNKTIELDPAFVKAYFMRGHILGGRRDYFGAIANFTKAIELEPNNWVWYSERGLTRLYAEDNDGAIADCLKIIERKGNRRWAYHFMGRAYEDKAWKLNQKGDIDAGKAEYTNAIASFTRAIAVDPKDAESYIYRSIMHSRTQDPDSALADINAVINIKPTLLTITVLA